MNNYKEQNKKYFATFILIIIICIAFCISFLAFLYIIVPTEQIIDGRVAEKLSKMQYDCKYEIQKYLLTPTPHME